MTVQISVQSDLEDVTKRYYRQIQDQLPFVTALALTKTGKAVQKSLTLAINRVFDAPTTTTKRAIEMVPAQKKDWPDPIAVVGFRDVVSSKMTNAQKRARTRIGAYYSGIPYSRYLSPSIRGGARPHKGFEKRLITAGIMKSTQFAVPSNNAKLNSSGNIPLGTLQQVLSQLKAQGDRYANESEKSASKNKNKKTQRYFIVRARDTGEPFGIYARKRGFIFPFLIFVNRAKYKSIFHYDDIARVSIANNMGKETKKAVEFAIRTAEDKAIKGILKTLKT